MGNKLTVTELAPGNVEIDVTPYGTRITANQAEAHQRLRATTLDRPDASFAAHR